jgi:hypothetical protein
MFYLYINYYYHFFCDNYFSSLKLLMLLLLSSSVVIRFTAPQPMLSLRSLNEGTTLVQWLWVTYMRHMRRSSHIYFISTVAEFR